MAEDAVLVLGILHVDEVNDDDAAHVAETELAADFFGSFEVGGEDGFVEGRGADLLSGVDINGGEGFGFVNDEVAAAGEPDLVLEESVEVFSMPKWSKMGSSPS